MQILVPGVNNRPSNILEAVAGYRYAPVGDQVTVTGSRSAPMGAQETMTGNATAPMEEGSTAFGNTRVPVRDEDALAGHTPAPMGASGTVAGTGLEPDTGREMTPNKQPEARPDGQAFQTTQQESLSQTEGCGLSFKSISGEGKFMYIDVSQVASQEREATGPQPGLLEKCTSAHGERSVFSCRQCDAAFMNKSLLEEHTHLKHPFSNPAKTPEMESEAEKTSSSTRPDSNIKTEPLSESDLETRTAVQNTSAATGADEIKSRLGGGWQVSQSIVDDGCFSCKTCCLTFPDADRLASHVKLHREEGERTDAGEKTFSLGKRPAAFECPRALKQLRTVRTGERPFSCEVCGATYKYFSDLNRHWLSDGHSGEKHSPTAPGETWVMETLPETSSEANEPFPRVETLSTSSADGEACLIAINNDATASGKHPTAPGQPFASSSETTRPPAAESPRIQPRAAGPDSAADPGFVVVKTEPLYLEAETAAAMSPGPGLEEQRPTTPNCAGGRRYSCAECGLKFKQSGTLNEHMRVHTGERPFPCSHCSLSFKRSTHLTTHILRKHLPVVGPGDADTQANALHPVEVKAADTTGSQEKSITEGGFIIKMEPLLESDTEMESEEGEEAGKVPGNKEAPGSFALGGRGRGSRRGRGAHGLSCTECSATFTKPGRLLVHMRVHTGERPFPCPHCDFSFKRSDHLKNHLLRKHPSAADHPAVTPGKTRATEQQSLEGRITETPAVGDSSGVSAVFSGFAVKSEPLPEADADVGVESVNAEDIGAADEGSCASVAAGEPMNPSQEPLDQQNERLALAQRDSQLGSEKLLPPSPTQCNLQPESGSSTEVKGSPSAEERPFSCPHCSMSFRKLTHLKIHTQRKHPLATKGPVPVSRVIAASELPLPTIPMQAARAPPVAAETPYDYAPAGFVIKKEPLLQLDSEMEHSAQNRAPGAAVCNSTATGSNGRRKPDHGDRKLSCPECSATFKQSGSLNEHMRVHTGERPFPCTQCGLSFKRSTHLRTHVLRKHAVQELESSSEDNAGSMASEPEVLLSKYARPQKGQTYRRYTGGKEPTFHCTECDASFLYPCELNQHTRIHTGERPFTCNVCHATFARSGNMKAHMRIHTGVKPFMCTVCSETFTLASKLKSHTLRKHTPGSLLQFHCADCDASFVYQSELRKHERSHLVNKPYPCSKCRASFSHPAALETHVLRKHTAGKMLPYPCTSCVSSFMSLGELKRHSRVHTGEKPFPCSECEESFAQSGTLKRHMVRKHSAGKS